MRKRSGIKSLCKSKYVLGLLFVVAAIILYNLLSKTKEGLEGQRKLYLFHMKNCGHCEKLMPEWDKFVVENKSGIKPISIEVGEKPELAKRYKINGYPTMILVNSDGKKIKEYDGERTVVGLLEFVHSLEPGTK